MTEIKIYFNDLAGGAQEELWRRVQNELLDYGEVAPKGRNENEREFQRRLDEETEYYFNTHNFVNRFVI